MMDHVSSEPLWTPSAERVASANLTRLRHRVEMLGGPPTSSPYGQLHQWSVDEPAAFWRLVWDFCEVTGEPGPISVTAAPDMRDVRFFPQARLNYAQNLLRGPGDDCMEAVVSLDEGGSRRAVTWGQLRSLVAQAAAALRADGVAAGDRVALWLPAGIEALVMMLAAASIGAVSSSTSPDFGTEGVLDRFGQIKPVVLVAGSGYRYGAKVFDCLPRIADISNGLASLRRTVLVDSFGDGATLDGTTGWAEWIAPHHDATPTYELLPFDHPLYVLYSSGTTGKPKCIMHGAGRVLLKHLTEHQLHFDIRPQDRVTWFTTTGWMMWNFLVSALASSATVIIYDGNPAYPGPHQLFRVATAERVTLLGLSAKFIDSVAKSGYRPTDDSLAQLPDLRAIGSTGSPLAPAGFEFVYSSVLANVHLASISGGTDICGCFVAGDPTAPVWSGEIQAPTLGTRVEAFNDEGQSIMGAPGELVCTQAFPSMPLGFWNDDTTHDPRGARYSAAYFSRFPGVWHHGDFITVTEHGGYVIHGRSDTTLNPGGVRIGTAEIYRVVEQIPDVAESLVFGQQHNGDTRIVLLIRLQPGSVLTDHLVANIKSRIRESCTPRHVPGVVVAVDDLPRTRSGKLMELAVADALNGRPVRNTGAIANPEALDAITRIAALKA